MAMTTKKFMKRLTSLILMLFLSFMGGSSGAVGECQLFNVTLVRLYVLNFVRRKGRFY